jgi:hypothetical protein
MNVCVLQTDGKDFQNFVRYFNMKVAPFCGMILEKLE